MKNIFTTLIFALVACTALQAQQIEHYTQFMYNKLRFNPAYAGSNNVLNATAIYRNQWMGFNGAPKTQIVSFDLPVADYRVGLGGTGILHTSGFRDMLTLEASYNYKIPTEKIGGSLSIGLSTSARYERINFNRASSVQPRAQDQALVDGGLRSKIVPNFGFGVYYHTENLFLGFSIPRILEVSIDYTDDGGIIGREVRHFFMMGGFAVEVADGIKIQPQALLKYTPDAPFDADGNISVTYMDQFTLGVGYRMGGRLDNSYGESVQALASVFLTEQLLLGAAYDYPLTEVVDYSSGSVEVALRYFFGDRSGDSGNQKIVNPRFF